MSNGYLFKLFKIAKIIRNSINFFVFIVLLLFYLPDTYALESPKKSSCQKQFESGLKFFKSRAEGTQSWKAQSSFIDSAIYHFERSIECSKFRQKSAYYYLRSLHFKAMYTDLTESERKELYNDVKILGEALAIEFPNDVGIKLWYLASAGKWIQYYGIFRAAYEGLGPKIKTTCERIIEIDPLYENGIGYRMLGIVYYQAPYIPVVLTWPDKEKGIQLTHKALEINPNNIGNLLFTGKLYFLDEQYEKASYYLNKCLKQTPRDSTLIMERFDQMKAKEFLEIIESKNFGQ